MTKKEFGEVFSYIKKYLRLNERDFFWSIEGQNSEISYELEYLKGSVRFSGDILDFEIKDIVSTVIHEFCHIYTGARSKDMLKNMEMSLNNNIGENRVNTIYNSSHTISELYTTKLERVFLEKVIETDRYKKLKKKYK